MIKTNWETDILVKRLKAVMRRKKPEIYFSEHKLTPNNRGYYNIWYTVSVVYKGQVFKIWHPENMKLCRKHGPLNQGAGDSKTEKNLNNY